MCTEDFMLAIGSAVHSAFYSILRLLGIPAQASVALHLH